MTVTTQTVDQLLRARSDKRLTDQIEALIAPIQALIASAGMTGDQPTKLALQDFQDWLFTTCAPGLQQLEIEAFISTTQVTSFVNAS